MIFSKYGTAYVEDYWTQELRLATEKEIWEWEYNHEHTPTEELRDCPHFDMG